MNNDIFCQARNKLKSNIEAHVRNWLPNGKREGHNYVSINPTRQDNTPGSFKINLNTGLWNDFATGDGGDIIRLYAYLNNISDHQAALKITGNYRIKSQFSSYIPSKASKPSKVSSKKESCAFASKIWQQCQNAKGTLVENYLHVRGCRGAIPAVIKYHPKLKHSEGIYMPAMVTTIQRWPYREIIAIHRTYLLPDGSGKADITPNKKLLGSATGGAVQLLPTFRDKPLVITEGIEDALSIYLATGYPAWSAISASLMSKIIIPKPDEIKKVIVAADNDKAGINNALKLAVRLMENNYKVSFISPKESGEDYNDLLLKGGKNGYERHTRTN